MPPSWASDKRRDPPADRDQPQTERGGKRISAWAAILFAPTLVGTIYGMNFDHMPELGRQFGYPAAVTAMIITGVIVYLIFKHRDCL